MGNSFSMMFISGVLLTLLCLIFRKPMLYLFGASDATYPYANAYITIYLLGSLFVMVGLGMNSFINSQGFGRIGMMTVLLGAAANILLDPIFIFVLHMGIRGAALATILSQLLSAIWILRFLTNSETETFFDASFRAESPENRRSRSVRFYDGDHQLHRPDHVQCNLTGIRRRSLRRRYDRYQLHP